MQLRCRIRTGDLKCEAFYNQRAGPKGLSASSNLAMASSQAAHRLRRLFMLRIKSHLALVPLLLLSKSKPHGRFMPRRQLRHFAVLGFDFVGDAGQRRSLRTARKRQTRKRLPFPHLCSAPGTPCRICLLRSGANPARKMRGCGNHSAAASALRRGSRH